MPNLPDMRVVDRAARRVRMQLPNGIGIEFTVGEIRKATELVPEDHPHFEDVRAMLRWFGGRGATLTAQQMLEYRAAQFTPIVVTP